MTDTVRTHIALRGMLLRAPALGLAATLSLFSAHSVFAETVVEKNQVIEQLLAVKMVSGLALSPDGRRAVYELATNDRDTDQTNYDLWLVEVSSGVSRQLTYSKESEWAPQWLPDGTAVGFLSDRHAPDDGLAQVWLLPVDGGEARQLTRFDDGVEDFAFSGDGVHLAAVVPEPDPFKAPDADADVTTAPPIVIDRFGFKADGEGYLTRERELHLFNIENSKTTPLASNLQSPTAPAFSPDGNTLALIARAGEKPDRGDNFDVYTVSLERPERASVIVQTSGADCAERRPVWSPDGAYIACETTEYDRDGYYGQYEIALIDVRSKTVKYLTGDIDLNVFDPHFSADGKSVLVTVEEDMMLRLASIDVASTAMQDVQSGKFSVAEFEPGQHGEVIALVSGVDYPSEVFLLKDGKRKPLSRHNGQLLAQNPWQDAEAIAFNSPDGTEIHGLLMRPVGAQKNRRYPTVLWIHGGPTSQFGYEARIEPQLFAAHGYAVIMVNPRGSTGRGLAFAKAILGAWGSVDVGDVLTGVDHVVSMGVADPDHLFVGGWSYGGMLTNYVIASDNRFNAAASGAGIANAWAGFGTDMYIHEYLSELGRPWEAPEAYNRVSYPFMHADRIETPTLFMVGENDYNVPLLASEQMYQALRVLEVPTRLVIYPGQGHNLVPPSYQVDNYQRYLDWFAQYFERGDRRQPGTASQ